MKKINYLGFAYSDVNEVGNRYYDLFFYFSIFLSLFSLFFIRPVEFGILSFFINLVIGITYKISIIRKSPGFIAVALNSILYIQIPFFYLLYMNNNYFFESQILLPKDNSFYLYYLTSAIFVFFISYLVMILGLILGNKIRVKKQIIGKSSFRRKSTLYVLIFFGILAAYIVYKDMALLFFSRANLIEKEENFFALLFNDKMMPIILAIFLYRFVENKKILKVYLLFILIYFILNFYGGTKAALLLVFIYFFVIPLSLYYNSKKKIVWPSKFFILVGLVLSPLLFIISLIFRELSSIGLSVNFSTLPLLISQLSNFDFMYMLDLICLRLSVSLNNYIVIYSEFFNLSDFSYRMEFVSYSTKGLMNLLLPGTPYPESYIPTSQLFSQVISKENIYSELTPEQFLRSANTQPYSLFGLLTIIFGPFSILISFLFGFIFSLIFKFINIDFIKALLIMSLYAFFQLYSLEGQIQYSFFLIIPALIVYYLINFFDKIKLKY